MTRIDRKWLKLGHYFVPTLHLHDLDGSVSPLKQEDAERGTGT